MTVLETLVSRRTFLRAGIYSAIAAGTIYPVAVESEWIDVREVDLSEGTPSCRLVHISDIHYKGGAKYLTRVIDRVNALSPDFVCFTGDLIEGGLYQEAALELIARFRVPVFGVPGNHDHWSGASFDLNREFFRKTGGDWVVDGVVPIPGKPVELFCADGFDPDILQPPAPRTDRRRILLDHFPMIVERLGTNRFDLILAGHSHGGQVRIPFVGPFILPPGVGPYDKGLYRTKAGPLYVNPGIGTYAYPIRFNCRPEITVIHV